MPTRDNVQNTHMSDRLRQLHSAVLDIVGMMNGPQRDDAIIRAAGIRLDRALFPLLVLIERLGPIGVVDLADRVGRDYTTVSRQLAKMEDLQLIERRANPQDRRQRQAVIQPRGKTMTDAIDRAREEILSDGFAGWSDEDFDALVRLMPRFAEALRKGQASPKD